MAKLLIVLTFFLMSSASCAEPTNSHNDAFNDSVFQNFDAFHPTSENEIPQNSTDGWVYSSNITTTNEYLKSACGWYDSKTYPENRSAYNFLKNFVCPYNNAHMGYETFGYLEIDDTHAVKGNSLKIVTTGGKNSRDTHGLKLHSKEQYLDYVSKGIYPVADDGNKVGHPYLYFMNNTLNQGNVPFPQAENKNRLSFYVKMPDEVNNSGKPPHSPQPRSTISIGPFNGSGGHWYHDVYNRGGGWTHVLIDGHPNHNNAYHNASLYPHPSYSLRDMDTDYFDTMYAFYITFSPYEGIAVPPYNIWLDEIQFYYDEEPQNNETINSPAITFHEDNLTFEVGFSDKYKANKDSWSQYEIKYSFEQITNDNFDDATYAIIQDDSRFKGVSYNNKGFFKKEWPYYQAVWAPFKIRQEDENKMKSGTKIYFAIRDLSNRPYEKGSFDEEGDTEIVPGTNEKRRVDLIKRIDYVISKNYSIPFQKL